MSFLEWLLQPIFAHLARIEVSLASLHQKADDTMTAVQIQQEALDEYAQAVSDVADELGSDIEALIAAAEAAGTPLPEANVTNLQASLQKLAALDQPDTEEVDPNDQPHPDNSLPTPEGEVDPGWTGAVAPEGEEGGAPQVNPL
jgi:hypothetical protein